MTRYAVPDVALQQPHCTEIIIRRSRFLAQCAHTPDPAAARAFVEQIRRRHADATHNCWAYAAGAPGDTAQIGSSDDGEPHGTAGRPMLQIVLHSGIGELCVVVSRWFGGVKLGTGGLVRAYGGTAGQCLMLAEKIELIEKKMVSFQCQFNEWAIFQYELTQLQAEYSEEYTAEGVSVTALLQIHQIAPLALKIQDVTRGREQLKIIEEPNDD